MPAFATAFFLSSAIPLGWACWANSRTSLIYAMIWTVFAWAAWLVTVLTLSSEFEYLALCLSACALMCVPGARRPGHTAWNFVMVGLLVLLLLPLGESLIFDAPMRLSAFRISFLSALLGMGLVNYLPTRNALSALILAFAFAIAMVQLMEGRPVASKFAALPAVAVWAAILCPVGVLRMTSQCERLWNIFRDRYGLLWAERIREQFNRAAANAKIGIELDWRRFRVTNGHEMSDQQQTQALNILTALVGRFGIAQSLPKTTLPD